MKVKPETFKQLIAVKNGEIIKIPNRILRKQTPVDRQDSNLTKNSVCIVCNFRFLENKIEWSNKVKAICHPFKRDDVFPKNVKKYLFSESDFCDSLISPTKVKMDKWNRKKFDFVYFTLNSKEGTRSKGIYTIPLLDYVAGKLGLKGLIIDYSKKETAKHKGTIFESAIVKVRKQMKKMKNLHLIKGNFGPDEVCAIMRSVKFVFLPSDADASPRMIVEPLIRNRPVVVSSAIYGGWKYISDINGSFFDAPTIEEYMDHNFDSENIESLTSAIEHVLSINNKKISKNFYEKWGFVNSSKRLAKIMHEISDQKYDAVAFKEWKGALKKSLRDGRLS